MTTATPPLEAPTLQVRLGDPRVVAQMLAATDALSHGHFALLGGDHADTFIRFSRVANQSSSLSTTAEWLLPSVAAWMPDAVVAPMTAGVSLAWVLSQRLGVPLFLAETGPDGRALALQDPELVAGRRVLLVNDVVTTGAGMSALARVARDAGAVVAGGTWFLARSDVDVSAAIDAPVSSVGDLLLERWSPESCPRCAEGDPFTHAVEIN